MLIKEPTKHIGGTTLIKQTPNSEVVPQETITLDSDDQQSIVSTQPIDLLKMIKARSKAGGGIMIV